MAKELKLIGEILADELFVKFVGEVVDGIKKDRQNRPEPKEGYRYRKDGVDTLQRDGNFNKEFIISSAESVWLRKSSLTSKTRGVVEFVCVTALHKAREAYAEMQG